MTKQVVLDIEIYGSTNLTTEAVNFLIKSFDRKFRIFDEDPWRFSSNIPIQLKYLENTSDISNLSERLWDFVVDCSISDKDYFYSIPNLVLLDNSFNPYWIREVTQLCPNTTINICEYFESYGFTEYCAIDGEFIFYRFAKEKKKMINILNREK